MIDAAEFERMVGYLPKQDDLERVNCDQAGEPAHWYCGVCEEHHKPRFACGCMYRKERTP